MANESPPAPEKDRSERWLLTYADLITLLLIFFIICYVMSVRDVVRFQAMAESVVAAFTGTKNIVGNAPGPSLFPGKSGSKVKGPFPRTKDRLRMEYIKQEVERLAEYKGLQTAISVKMEERGMVIRIMDKVLFASGYADLNPRAKQILSEVGKILLVNKDQFIRIEGHTDNVPISNEKFASNWELSASRATNVVKMFINEVGINPNLLSAVGYGEFRPIAENNTAENRSKNRRVEIVLLHRLLGKSESPSATAQE